MFLLSVRCCGGCLLIITLTGLLQIINAESFRPIFNPNVPHRPTAKKLTAITSTTTSTTTTTTARPLTTISATLKSRVLLTKQKAAPSPSIQASSSQHQAVRAPIKPLATPSAQSPPQSTSNRNANDNVAPDTKDAPVAEALRGHWRRWRRPYYYPASNLLPNPRYRRRPNPKPYYAPPSGGYGFGGYAAPYEDYRFETDFLDTNPYVPKAKPKYPGLQAGKNYGVVDTDIGAFYDSQSATFNVPPLKNYDSQSGYFGGSGTATGSAGLGTGSAGLGTGFGSGTGLGGASLGSIHSAGGSSAILGAGYSTGIGGKGSIGTGAGIGSGAALANLYSDYGDSDYKFSTTKPKTNYKNLPSRAPVKPAKTRTKHNYNNNDDEYRYPSGDTSHYSSGVSSLESDDTSSDPKSAAKYNDIYLPPRNIYQTPSKKPKQRPTKSKTTTTTTTTTFTPPINIGSNSIDVLTKPLGSATFNLNLSPGTIYNPQPPQINYNQPSNNFKSVQPIPLQPPSTSYGVPIAPPLNAYTYQNQYQNSYQNQYNPPSYPPSAAQNNNGYVDPSSVSITNDLARTPGPFAEPPPLNQQTLSNVEVSYNNVQTSYDATPKNTRPTKRKPTKVNSKRVSTKRPALNLDEELADDEDNTENSDYYGESYSFYKTMPQPSLPNTYDQDDFHTVKNKRKQSKQSFSYDREERSRTTKKPRQPIEVTLRIPDEDYLDDLVKVVQTTKRPKKKTKLTTSHVLDTEDLRDAYDNNSAFYAKKKSKSSRYTTQQPDYDDNYDDDNDDDDYDTDRLSNVNSKEDTKSSDTDAEGTQNSPYWDKNSSIYKQYGIRARNDNFASSTGYEVQSYNNGFRPIRNDHSKTYVALNHPADVRAPYATRDIVPLLESHNFMLNSNRIASTLHTITTTTPKTTTLFVWNGGELPKNHKMA